MLVGLRVKNLGIIDEIDWELQPGLNVITGETGAGKSLVVDAIEALLLGRLDEEAIRYGADDARIEGVFGLTGDDRFSSLRRFAETGGIDIDDDALILRCEVRKQGRSVIRVNGQTVTKGLLRQLGNFLIDVHGQSEHLSLLNKDYHMDILDAYAHTTGLRNEFSDKANELNRLKAKLRTLVDDEAERARREEFLRFQIDEIAQAQLREGEDEELERERIILSSAERLKELSFEAYLAICGDETANRGSPALESLSDAARALKQISDLDPDMKPQQDAIDDLFYRLEEVARDIKSYTNGLEHDPRRLEEIELRLDVISRLKRKYGGSIAEVLDYLRRSEEEYEGMAHSSEQRDHIEKAISSIKNDMGRIAAELSEARSEAAGRLNDDVGRELQELDMSNVGFNVSIAREPSADGIPLPDGDSYAFNDTGIDYVEFMASTNPGEPFKPLAKIASTGEISRFTLALKGAISEADNIPVLVFDEIDIGIGGRSGEMIGRKLWRLARDRQVICITHLSQIAAFADAHYVVRKESLESRTSSMIQSAQDDDRIYELAAMIAGPQYSENALKSAREMAGKAEAWKKGQTQVKNG
ncbi:MAG: DNA repair protein RecN [Chloroflexota bacterium]|nr:DNA repair protein RecN [Chloroflexota bacterium]